MLTANDIIKECLKGNRLAMQILYKQHCNKVLGICRRYAPHKDEAHDWAHDIWILIFEKLHQFKNSGPIDAWLCIVTRNQALKFLKERKKIDFQSLSETEFPETDISTSELEHMMDLFSMDEILESLEQIPIQHKTIFNLYVVDDFSHKEISEQLNISETNSKSILSRARQKLIHILRQRVAKKKSILVPTSTTDIHEKKY